MLMAENQSLKTSGSEALLAAQWRQRYETCLAEKEDLEARLSMEVEKADASAEQRRKVDAGKYEMKYRDLKESFRLYRKKAKEIFEAQQRGDIGVRYINNLGIWYAMLYSLLERALTKGLFSLVTQSRGKEHRRRQTLIHSQPHGELSIVGFCCSRTHGRSHWHGAQIFTR